MNLPSDAFPPSRVLCVDGDCATLEMLTTGLDLYGFFPVTASDGEKALRIYQDEAENCKFDALVISLTHTDGLILARAVRDLGYQKRIIIISNALPIDALHAYSELGVSGFFRQPFDAYLLTTMLLKD
jgi:DNA-binding NtrC family response regulator